MSHITQQVRRFRRQFQDIPLYSRFQLPSVSNSLRNIYNLCKAVVNTNLWFLFFAFQNCNTDSLATLHSLYHLYTTTFSLQSLSIPLLLSRSSKVYAMLSDRAKGLIACSEFTFVQ